MLKDTAEDVRAWKERWKLFNQWELEQLRATPAETKFQQLVQLYEIGTGNDWLKHSEDGRKTEELLFRKLLAGQPNDLEDARGIMDSQASLDLTYLRRRIREFSDFLVLPELSSHLEHMLVEAGCTDN